MTTAGASAVLGQALSNIWTRVGAFAQSMFRDRRERRLRVCETLALGDKRQLMIVDCAGRRLLIGAAGNFLATLAELGEEHE